MERSGGTWMGGDGGRIGERRGEWYEGDKGYEKEEAGRERIGRAQCYLDGVWSTVMMSSSGMSCSKTRLQI